MSEAKKLKRTPMKQVGTSAVLSRIEALEKRVHDLGVALENSRPAIQAASMFIPIGGNGPYIHKQEPLGEPFSTILNESLDELYER